MRVYIITNIDEGEYGEEWNNFIDITVRKDEILDICKRDYAKSHDMHSNIYKDDILEINPAGNKVVIYDKDDRKYYHIEYLIIEREI